METEETIRIENYNAAYVPPVVLKPMQAVLDSGIGALVFGVMPAQMHTSLCDGITTLNGGTP